MTREERARGRDEPTAGPVWTNGANELYQRILGRLHLHIAQRGLTPGEGLLVNSVRFKCAMVQTSPSSLDNNEASFKTRWRSNNHCASSTADAHVNVCRIKYAYFVQQEWWGREEACWHDPSLMLGKDATNFRYTLLFPMGVHPAVGALRRHLGNGKRDQDCPSKDNYSRSSAVASCRPSTFLLRGVYFLPSVQARL